MRTSGAISVATLHLMVGLPCSGKTTLAQKLESEQSALRLTPDEWHVRLFGQDVEEPEHDVRHSLIETMLWNIANRALVLGTNVILDFGFWAREEREDFRSRAKQLGASSEVHFLDVSDDELMRRLAVRKVKSHDVCNSASSRLIDQLAISNAGSTSLRSTIASMSAIDSGRK